MHRPFHVQGGSEQAASGCFGLLELRRLPRRKCSHRKSLGPRGTRFSVLRGVVRTFGAYNGGALLQACQLGITNIQSALQALILCH